MHPSKVLVSGANGFIGVWIVHALLEKGYTVYGTIRSKEKGDYLKKLFKVHADRLHFFIVEDIAKEGAFDEAVKGVDAIIHSASPFHMDADEPQELINPAVQGTVGILKSAMKYGTSVKRVVVTSSCAAILESLPEPKKFDETNWNEKSIKQIEKEGRNAPNLTKYQASKTLAEKAAWDLWNEHKNSLAWDLTVLNPPYVFGPVIHEVKAVESLNTSMLLWYNTVVLGKSLDTVLGQSSAWVDVRDLALAHVKAIENDAAGGERIIVSSSEFIWQDWIKAAHAHSSLFQNWRPAGDPALQIDVVYMLQYDTAKADKLLGIKYKDMGECTKGILCGFDQEQWLKRGTQ